jgi:aryl-alcohol dehydrogenase-like predicted oxidoreductase
MKRRAFLGATLATLPITGAFAAQPKPKASGDIPTTRLGTSGIEVQIIAQGGARMDLHPDIPSAAKHVREVYDLGVRYFDCARMYWNGQSEEAYGLGLQGVRKDVFLTSKSAGRTAKDAEKDLETSLRLLKTDHVDLWQMHNIMTLDDVQAIMKPGGAMEAFEAAKKAGKCRVIGFTGHFDPDAHVAMLKAYDRWDTVMMPVHAADHAYLSFEQIALPVAVARGVPNQAIKVFGKANLLRSLSPDTCLRYALSQPGTPIAICGCGTVGQMADNIRAVQNFQKMTPDESAEVRKRAIVGSGVYTGTMLEYWKKRA